MALAVWFANLIRSSNWMWIKDYFIARETCLLNFCGFRSIFVVDRKKDSKQKGEKFHSNKINNKSNNKILGRYKTSLWLRDSCLHLCHLQKYEIEVLNWKGMNPFPDNRFLTAYLKKIIVGFYFTMDQGRKLFFR